MDSRRFRWDEFLLQGDCSLRERFLKRYKVFKFIRLGDDLSDYVMWVQLFWAVTRFPRYPDVDSYSSRGVCGQIADDLFMLHYASQPENLRTLKSVARASGIEIGEGVLPLDIALRVFLDAPDEFQQMYKRNRRVCAPPLSGGKPSRKRRAFDDDLNDVHHVGVRLLAAQAFPFIAEFGWRKAAEDYFVSLDPSTTPDFSVAQVTRSLSESSIRVLEVEFESEERKRAISARCFGEELNLPPRCVKVLGVLCKNENQMVTRDRVLNAIYGTDPDEQPHQDAVDQCICEIRKAIGARLRQLKYDPKDAFSIICTMLGTKDEPERGYMLRTTWQPSKASPEPG